MSAFFLQHLPTEDVICEFLIKVTCACSYGRLTEDGKGCEEFKAFLMYSRVSRIESLQMYNASDLNAPLAPIESEELGRYSVIL